MLMPHTDLASLQEVWFCFFIVKNLRFKHTRAYWKETSNQKCFAFLIVWIPVKSTQWFEWNSWLCGNGYHWNNDPGYEVGDFCFHFALLLKRFTVNLLKSVVVHQTFFGTPASFEKWLKTCYNRPLCIRAKVTNKSEGNKQESFSIMLWCCSILLQRIC